MSGRVKAKAKAPCQFSCFKDKLTDSINVYNLFSKTVRAIIFTSQYMLNLVYYMEFNVPINIFLIYLFALQKDLRNIIPLSFYSELADLHESHLVRSPFRIFSLT